MIKIKAIKPMFTALVTTMHKYEDDQYTAGGLIDPTKNKQGGIKEYQTVVSIGDSVRNINIGDTVCINPKRFAKMEHEKGSFKDGVVTDNPVVRYEFDVIELNDVPHLLLQDRDIEFIVTEFEEIEDPKPKMKIIQPPKKSIILN